MIMKSELIKITEKDGRQIVSARELYITLGYDVSHYARWAKSNISDNPYASEGEDWCSLAIDGDIDNQPVNPSTDYAISVTMAKKIAMMSKTDVGNEIRDYFIECEKLVKSQFKVPSSFKEALMLAVEQQELIEQQQLLIEEQKPKADFFDAVADSKDAIPMLEVAKVLNAKGMGRNNLFEFLREQKVLMRDNLPYEKYIDRGYFRVIEQKYMKNGEPCMNIKTLVYQRGLDFIRKLIEKKIE